MNTIRRLSRFAATALCSATLFFSVGCGGGARSQQGSSLSDLADTDLASLIGDAAAAARASIDQARGEALPKELSPLAVFALGKHHLVLSRSTSSATGLQADLVSATGTIWSRELSFNSSWELVDYSVGSHAEVNHPVLLVSLKAPGNVKPAASRFYIAITANSGLLVRALNDERAIADNLISAQHPELIIDRGNIADNDSAAQLAAIVYFAQPGAKDDHRTARVIGHLEDLARGTNLWLAEGAALVLTQN